MSSLYKKCVGDSINIRLLLINDLRQEMNSSLLLWILLNSRSVFFRRNTVDVRCESIKKKEERGFYFAVKPPHFDIKTVPRTETTVITTPTTIPIIRAVVSANPPSYHRLASFIAPIIISFQIRAMMKPNAAAIATAIVLFISFMVTMFHLPTFF